MIPAIILSQLKQWKYKAYHYKATTLSEHVVTRMRRLDSQNGGQKHLESVEA